jgi:hypothetical protein
MPSLRPVAIAALVVSLSACDKPPEPPAPAPAKPAPTLTATASAPVEPLVRLPAPARLVAIGDLHGDLEATRKALRIAGAIDDKDQWAGGALVVVQTGDQLDRGDGERKILDLLDRLADEAKAKGGSVLVLNGNHEVMNVQLDFRYVTDAGFKDFAGVPGALTSDPRLAALPEREKVRAAAFLPGAPYAKRMAKRPIAALVGDSVFVHGGILPKHVTYGIERMNREVSAFMDGGAKAPPPIVVAEDGPIWSRRYSAAPAADDCKVLHQVLGMMAAKRMVVGHTVQRDGISSACGGEVWRIDVGLSHHYGGKPQVLEIKGDEVRPLGPS